MANRLLNFDIDTYLNGFVLPSPLGYLPRPVAHFLGHRDPGDAGDKTCNLVRWLWAFIGAFCGIALIEGVYMSSSTIQSLSPPLIIASFGASSILEYNTIDSPLSQPRNLVLGQFLSALTGVGITKLFQLLPVERFEALRWLAGALAVGAASFVMGITKTIHPPAGATALLAATSPDITALGWWLLPLDLIASSLMLGSALLINNIQRRFPTYWWTPVDLRAVRKRKHESTDIEKKSTEKETPKPGLGSSTPIDPDKSGAYSDSSVEASSIGSNDKITITANEISIPDWLDVSDWTREMLEVLKQRLSEQGQ